MHYLKKFYGPFLWIGFNFLKGTGPLKVGSLLLCLLLYIHLPVYSKCMGSGIQTTVKTNELSSNLTSLQIGESTIHRVFVVWLVLVEAIFSCLNLMPDDGFLPYSLK